MEPTLTHQTTSGADTSAWSSTNGDTGTNTFPTITGRYRLLEEIARGGMGVVHRAFDTILEREVALKLIHEKYKDDEVMRHRFLEEARITGQLQHPGIPPIHDVAHLPDGRPFLAMKLIKGKTLEKLLKEEKPTGGRKQEIFESVCQALAYAHSKGVIHRDLKPANVMVGAFGETQVMDWGLAKLLDPQNPDLEATELSAGSVVVNPRGGDSISLSTQAGSVIGTYAYMPPEQALGAKHLIGEVSDVFGLGAVLCELLTLKPPYVKSGEETTQYLASAGKLAGAFERIDACDADPELKSICKRCLSVDVRGRPANAGELVAEIALFRHATEERARTAEMKAAKVAQRRKYLMGLALVLLAGALGAIYLAMQARNAEYVAEAHAQVAMGEADRANKAALASEQMAGFLVGLFESEDELGIASANLRFRNLANQSNHVSDLLERGVERLNSEKGLKDQPAVRARLLNDIAAIFLGIGKPALAKPLADEALQIRRGLLRKEDPELLKNLRLVAQLEYLNGDYLSCLARHREVIAALTASEPDGLALADTKASLAICLAHVAKSHPEARALLEEAYAVCRKKLGPGDLRRISTGWLLAISRGGDDPLKALQLAAELQKDLETLGGDKGLAEVMRLATLALVVRGTAGELQVWRNLIAQCTKVFGEAHFLTLRAKTRLAGLLYDMKSPGNAKFEEAAGLYTEVMKDGSRWERNFSRFNLARTLMRMGRGPEALPLLEESVAEYRRECKELNASHLPHALELLAWLYDRSPDPAKRGKVEELVTEAYREARSNPHTEPGRLFLAIIELARFRMARDPLAPVLFLFDEVMPILKTAEFKDSLNYLETLAYHQAALRKAGMAADADRIRSEIEKNANLYSAGNDDQSIRIRELLDGKIPLWQGREGLVK